jgi:hypothetical protein
MIIVGKSVKRSIEEKDDEKKLSNNLSKGSGKRQELASQHTRFTSGGGQPLERQTRAAYEAEQQGKENRSPVGEDPTKLLKDHDRDSSSSQGEISSQEAFYWSAHNDAIAEEIKSFQLEMEK